MNTPSIYSIVHTTCQQVPQCGSGADSMRCGYKHLLTILVLHGQKVSPVLFSRMCVDELRRGDDYPLMESNKLHSSYNSSSQDVVLEEVGDNSTLKL